MKIVFSFLINDLSRGYAMLPGMCSHHLHISLKKKSLSLMADHELFTLKVKILNTAKKKYFISVLVG